MQNFRKLHVWQEAHRCTLAVYAMTQTFPRSERFGLIDQMRRSSASVPTNIAEGCGRGSDADFARFLRIAMGSACELDYQLLLAQDLGYLDETAFNAESARVASIKRMLNGLLRSLKRT